MTRVVGLIRLVLPYLRPSPTAVVGQRVVSGPAHRQTRRGSRLRTKRKRAWKVTAAIVPQETKKGWQ